MLGKTLLFLLAAHSYVNSFVLLPLSSHSCRPALVMLLSAMKVNIRIVGKKISRETWLEQGYDEYQTRLRSGGIDVSTEWHKSNNVLIKNVEKDNEKGYPVILLDPQGAVCSSEEFCSNFYKWMEQGGSRLVFVIGGAEGLPESLKRPFTYNCGNGTKRSHWISLSKLTFTHQFARLLLIEQVYRASEIQKGSEYHK